MYQTSWSGAGEVVLEEARDPRFGDAREIYRGSDRATTLTGRPDGTYHYRLHTAAAGAPATASVTVEHHPLGRALGFFAIGLVVFGATTALVLRGPDEGPAERR